jgi:hypothetical protein
MKTKLMALLLVVGGSLFAQPRFSVGVNFGAPAYYGPAPVAVAYRPACPGPGYVWIDGYRDGYGRWTAGYWAAPRSYGGYWGGARPYYRNDYRFRESREHEWREHERREHERREHDFRR